MADDGRGRGRGSGAVRGAALASSHLNGKFEQVLTASGTRENLPAGNFIHWVGKETPESNSEMCDTLNPIWHSEHDNCFALDRMDFTRPLPISMNVDCAHLLASQVSV